MIRYAVTFLILLLGLQIAPQDVYAKRGKEKENLLSLEAMFMKNNFSEKGVGEWNSGRKFLCVTENLPALLVPPLHNTADKTNWKGKNFEYKAVAEVNGWRGIESSILFLCDGDTFKYIVKKPASDVFAKDFRPLLPELVPEDYIRHADSLLSGRMMYIKTPRWKSSEGLDIFGKKYVPVTVNRVEAGDKILPVKIHFTDTAGVSASILTTMYINNISAQYTSFDKLFSFTDPKLKYPHIKDDVWRLITASLVKENMTKDECLISLGSPDKIIRVPDYSGLCEKWLYNNGKLLEFKDGVLVRHR